MEYVNQRIHSSVLDGIVNLPENLKNQTVEILIMPEFVNFKSNQKVESLFGSLSRYADNSLQISENEAFEIAMKEKYGNR